MRNFHIPVYFYALTAMLFWGMSFIWTTSLLKYYQPVTIIIIRLIISSALLFGILRFFWPHEKLEKKDLKLVLLSAMFNPFLYFIGESYGLKYSTPTISAVIIATIPVFSPVIAFLSYREKLTTINFIGIAVSFAGVLLMLVTRDFSLATDVKGVIFLAGAVLAALFYSVTLRKLTTKYTALLLIAWQNMLGIFLFLPYFLFFEVSTLNRITINSEIIYAFLFLAILASSVAFVFYAHSVRLLGISKTNIFSNLIPVFTAFFSWILIDEQFTMVKIAGIVLVIGGVYLSERSRKRL